MDKKGTVGCYLLLSDYYVMPSSVVDLTGVLTGEQTLHLLPTSAALRPEHAVANEMQTYLRL